MSRRTFRIGSWLALLGGVIAMVAAMSAATIGTLALMGKVTYPVDIGVGPFSITSTVSMPVALHADVCQKASVDERGARDCFRFFLHEARSESMAVGDHRQDADVQPLAATLRGEAILATTGGWSPYIAAQTVGAVIRLGVISGVLLLLWRLLAAAAAGEPFGTRTVRLLRGIGWLVIAGALLEPALAHFTSAGQLGYSMTMFGPGPHLMPSGSAGYPSGVDLWQLALGGLALLLAAVFRHGAAIEAESRLTV